MSKETKVCVLVIIILCTVHVLVLNDCNRLMTLNSNFFVVYTYIIIFIMETLVTLISLVPKRGN